VTVRTLSLKSVLSCLVAMRAMISPRLIPRFQARPPETAQEK
jgi:hypothetical protein